MDLILTLILIGINVLVFLLPYILPASSNFSSADYLIRLGGISRGSFEDGEYYRLLTSTFLHGGFVHLLVNMISLIQIGPAVGSYFGTLGFFLIYIGSGLTGSLASAVFNNTLSVGASGAIFGLVGALLSVAIFRSQVGLLSNLIGIIAINLFIGYTSGGRIDNWGHIGGLFGGFVIATAILLTQSFGLSGGRI